MIGRLMGSYGGIMGRLVEDNMRIMVVPWKITLEKLGSIFRKTILYIYAKPE
jgi:hypothetical protein